MHQHEHHGEGRADGLQVCLLADDLTGACDAAIAFAERGYRTETPIDGHATPAADVEVWAVNAETRDMPPALLASTLAAHLRHLPEDVLLFKKIDSVLRGNTLDEIVALRNLQPGRPLVLAPAAPLLGRTTVNGVVHVSDLCGTREIPLVSELNGRGAAVPVVPAHLSIYERCVKMKRLWESGQLLVCCDAQTQQHLEAVVETVRLTEHSVCWIGSAGLAAAVAGSLPARTRAESPSSVRKGVVAFFVGSNHPVTLQQVTALHEHARSRQHDPIHVIAVERNADQGSLRRQVADLDASNTACLFMTGGDTASAVCRALGITSLRAEREFAPGLPQTRAVGGRFAGVPVLLKSGGFGHGELLCTIATTFGGEVSSAADEVFQVSGDVQ